VCCVLCVVVEGSCVLCVVVDGSCVLCVVVDGSCVLCVVVEGSCCKDQNSQRAYARGAHHGTLTHPLRHAAVDRTRDLIHLHSARERRCLLQQCGRLSHNTRVDQHPLLLCREDAVHHLNVLVVQRRRRRQHQYPLVTCAFT
jgi:hypothetical protein